MANPRRVVRRITLTADATDALAAMLAPLTDSRRAALPPPTLADRDAVAALCPEGAVHQGMVLAVAPLPGFDLTALLARLAPPAPCLLLVLDQVTDPRNVGAICAARRPLASTVWSCPTATRRRKPAPWRGPLRGPWMWCR